MPYHSVTQEHLDDDYLAIDDGDPRVWTSIRREGVTASVTVGRTVVFTGKGVLPGDLSAYLRRVADKLDIEYGRWISRQGLDQVTS